VGGRVLVVDDEVEMQRALRTGLRYHDFDVRTVGSGEEAVREAAGWRPDVILLDLGLPKMDGFATLRALRPMTRAAVIVVSVMPGEKDKVRALDAGADDYVVKPFAMEELAARLQAVLRRSRGTGGEKMQVGDLLIDVPAGTAHRAQRRVDLTAIEFRLLCALARQAGKLLSQGQLLDIVWPVGQGPDSNSIEVHIARLRRKLEAGGEERILHTVRGMGYVLKPEEGT
jgi:DNA-binding response OmpR family regulator